jgi:2-aminoethylphosphonate-pyruvate transaminase
MTHSDPLLLTPGPLTTSAAVKAAMQHDWGSRDHEFIAMNQRVCEQLVDLAHATSEHVCVPIQGSGTFAIEATLGTLIPRTSKTLILVNGAYGRRMAKILSYHGRKQEILETAEDVPVSASAVDARLRADADIGYVLAVHCETTSGILNPISDIAAIVSKHARHFIIDAMSAFGALELDARHVRFDALVASSNKCLEGVPGLGFAIMRETLLADSAGNAPALSLDLHDQWRAMQGNGQWRFTPPTHVLAALDQALNEHREEGGVAGRHARYAHNCRILIDGMRELGFETLLSDAVQAPIIVTFRMPSDPRFDFQAFYDRLAAQGFVIYPGKLTVAPSFRIGCIGHLNAHDMRAALRCIGSTLKELGLEQCGASSQQVVNL